MLAYGRLSGECRLDSCACHARNRHRAAYSWDILVSCTLFRHAAKRPREEDEVESPFAPWSDRMLRQMARMDLAEPQTGRPAGAWDAPWVCQAWFGWCCGLPHSSDNAGGQPWRTRVNRMSGNVTWFVACPVLTQGRPHQTSLRCTALAWRSRMSWRRSARPRPRSW